MREALVVAVGGYANEALRSLSTPTADAQELSAILRDPQLGRFDHVAVLVDPDAPTFAAAVERLFCGASRRSADTVTLYYSGHGIKDVEGRLYLAAQATDPALLLSTSVSAAFIHDVMQRCVARAQVVILDCCFAGAFGRDLVKSGRDVGLIDNLPPSKGRVVLAASSAIEFSFEEDVAEGDRARRSVFTEAMVEGMRSGKADLDGDGIVTVDEIFTYASERLADAGRPQRPVRFAIAQDGQIALAQVAGRAHDDRVLETPGRGPAMPVPRPGRHRSTGWVVAACGMALGLAAAVVFASRPDGSDERRTTSTATTAAPAVTTPRSTAPTTAAGATTRMPGTTTVVSTTRSAARASDLSTVPVVGLLRADAEAALGRAGWTVKSQPGVSPTASVGRVLAVRATSANEVALVIGDNDTCSRSGAAWTYCDGRPIAHFSWSRADGRIAGITPGTVITVKDQTTGDVRTRKWSWRQGGSSGVFTDTGASPSLTVNGRAGESIVLSLEVTNAKGKDAVEITLQVV